LRSASLVGEGLGQEGLLATVGLTRGFRHQIRAHFAWIGLPLLGDRLYGGVERPFLALVATELGFEDPETGLPLRIRDDSIASPLSLT
jgi:23S rRNA-/tRNA-specific pseudouridylate synthase